jgi:hypothetical protein
VAESEFVKEISSLQRPKGKLLLGNLIDFRFRTLDFLDEITASGQPIIHCESVNSKRYC